ncbi:MAG: hypothetical protein IID40_10130, partial [Planctomycetes bacterium]|nr:hypothetical protein [Planctomycetota bacterium]
MKATTAPLLAEAEARREAARKMSGSFSGQDAASDATVEGAQAADKSKAELPGRVKLSYDDRQGVIVIEGTPREVDEVREMLKDVMDEI